MKKKGKPESFDLLQYFYGSVHDPLIHGMLHVSGHLDEQVLKKAVTMSLQAVPLIACRIRVGKRLLWERSCFTGEDIVRVVETRDREKDAERMLASTIDMENEPQLKIFIVRDAQSDTLCVIMSHLVTDGAGLKEYLYLLCDLYSRCANGETDYPDLKPVLRGTGQLFQRFGWTQKLRIFLAKYDLSALKTQPVMRLEGNRNTPFFVTCRMVKDELAAIKTYTKKQGCTVNDVLLTAYGRVLARNTRSAHVVIPCPVDLRKYQPKAAHSVANLTTNYICTLDHDENSSFSDALQSVSTQMRKQKDSDDCLKSVLSLEIAFHLLPFWLLRRTFAKLFTIPVVSFTNFGVIDQQKLRFGGVQISDAFLTGAVKFTPYFQVAVSTFDDVLTMSCNLHGTGKDRAYIELFLKQIHNEVSDAIKAS